MKNIINQVEKIKVNQCEKNETLSYTFTEHISMVVEKKGKNRFIDTNLFELRVLKDNKVINSYNFIGKWKEILEQLKYFDIHSEKTDTIEKI